MGFFSQRRSEDVVQDNDGHQSVVRVIRSRFYGKAGKGRSSTHGVEPSSSSSHLDGQHSHLSSIAYNGTALSGSGRSPVTTYHASSAPSTPGRISSSTSRYFVSSPSSPRARPVTHMATSPQVSKDAITLTLAQRLQELATANAEGLLNDDEYRLLRQDLFDRLAGVSAVPQETPLVPITNQQAEAGPSRLSRYDTESTRASSTISKRSLSSTVSGLLKRATSKRRSSSVTEQSDAASIYSTTSNAQRSIFQRPLARQSSEASFSIDSPRMSRADSIKQSKSRSNSVTRSVRSSRKGSMPPPSSFPGLPQAHTAPIDGSADDEQLRTTQDIRREIEAVEAESKRLLDAFNGLELSTLVKQQRHSGLVAMHSNGRLRAGSGSMHERLSSRMDVDTNSIRSNGTGRTQFSSVNRLPAGEGLARRQTSNASSLQRKNSISAMSTHSKGSSYPITPITPTSPSRHLSRLRVGSQSSLNLSRSANHLPLAPVAEKADMPPHPHPLRRLASEPDDMSETTEEVIEEMNEIQRRKAEVAARYEARIEYLRARLKGAELREKLLKS